MDISTTKLNLVQKILTISEVSLLDKINTLLDKELIVGYTTDGKPLTLKEYNQRIKVAEEQLSTGQYIAQEDLENEVKNW